MLDEVRQSYSRQGNPKLDQIRYITKIHDQEYVDLEVVRLLSKIYGFCEGHVIIVVTLALGLRPRQRFTRLRAKRKVESPTTYSRECEKV